MRVILRILAGPYQDREFTFDHHDTFLIGRSEAAHLYLPEDKFFSRHHCLLEIAPPRCFLRDLGSTNGTFVNGRKVQEAFLSNGDRIQGGQTLLEVEVQSDQPAAPVSAAPEAATRQLTHPVIVTVECANCGRRDHAEASAPNEAMTFLCEDCREELKNRPQPIPGYEMRKILGLGGARGRILPHEATPAAPVAVEAPFAEAAAAP